MDLIVKKKLTIILDDSPAHRKKEPLGRCLPCPTGKQTGRQTGRQTDKRTHRLTEMRYYDGQQSWQQIWTEIQLNGKANKRASVFRILHRSSEYATVSFSIDVYKTPATKKKQEIKPYDDQDHFCICTHPNVELFPKKRLCYL